MSKLGLVVLLLAQILILQVMAHESEAQAPLSVPGLNPLEHKNQTRVQFHDQKTDKIADHHLVSGTTESSSSSEEEGEFKAAEAPHPNRRLGKHHSTDKSVAGGGVIIGGLVTATFAAIFCYIRVTRKRDSDYRSSLV
ncbi:hypothetical protein SESBI_44031 [Sesbania bispinosa]|nr:hypothetical protein SESBI_44031 [Sesbania bispinosa]